MDAGYLKSEGDINITPEREQYRRENIDAATQYWLDEDSKYFIHQSLSTPCLNVMKSSHGATFTDAQGRTFFDFHGNNVHQVGFGNPQVVAAITRQMQELPFCTRRYTNIPAIQLAKKLSEMAPGDLNRVLFAPSGALAIGMALKLARASTGRFKTISMWDSFHGASLDTISIGGEAVFRSEIGPLLPGTEHVPPPDAQNCPWDCAGSCKLKCADYIEYVLEKEGDVAAVIAETVRSTPYIPPVDYWKKIRAACDRHGALLILDEIPHCLGRTGKMFTFENYGIVPDMVVIGKGLGGGIFPLAALIAREGLNVMKNKALGHYTHEKNPVACAAALAAIKYIEDEKILTHVSKLGQYTIDRLNQMKKRFPIIKDVRGIGLLIGVELARQQDGENIRAVNEAEKIMYKALQNGLNFKLTMGNILTLTPALTLTKNEMDEALSILEKCFEEIT
ncbi:MAG: (R)-1-hydroxy-2-aminoethylphosphonate ammonia-lyase [Bacteroidota bacterium]